MNDREHGATPDHSGQPTDSEIHSPLADLIRIRRQKIDHLKQQQIEPYPYKYDRTHAIAELQEQFDALAAAETVVRLWTGSC